jgi:hypothetical protein
MKKFTTLIAVAALCAGLSANAAMVIYTGTTPLLTDASHPITAGVVGTIGGTTGQGQGGWGTFQQTAAQDLLNLALGGSGTSGGEAIYANTVYDYSGTVDTAGSSFSGGAANTTVPAGWNFVIAKYDGKQAGYVVYYLGGQSETLPTTPLNYWTTTTGQYGISGWTAFNAVPEPTTLVAGALLLLPFGASTIRILRKKRAA